MRHDSPIAADPHARGRIAAVAGLVVSLIGLTISSWLLARANASTAAADCIVRLPGDCGAVLRSGYGRFLQLPLPGWGVVYFTAAAAAFGIAGRSYSPRWLRPLVWIVACGVASGGWLSYVMWRLDSWCGTCVLVHGLNLLLLVLAIVIAVRRAMPKFRLGLEWLAVALATFTLWGVLHRRESNYAGLAVQPVAEARPSRSLNDANLAPASHAGQNSYPLVVGRDGDVRVRLFVDPTCRECSRLWEMMNNIRRDHPGRLCIEIHFFPLEKKCNPYVARESAEHRGACRLAQLAHYVSTRSGQEDFADFYAAIGPSEGAARWSAAEKWAARRLGTTLPTDAIDAEEVRQRLQNDIDLALDYGVESLPTLVVGGKKHAGCPRDRGMLLDVLQPFLDRTERESEKP